MRVSYVTTDITMWRKSQLPTNHPGINTAPSIITYSPPNIALTEFHTTFMDTSTF